MLMWEMRRMIFVILWSRSLLFGRGEYLNSLELERKYSFLVCCHHQLHSERCVML
jgi:hypothetical protein